MTSSDPAGDGGPLRKMFDAVPDRYDMLNRLLTMTLDERWRRRAARLCLEPRPARVLDLCCGTGDLALRIHRMSRQPPEIVGLDYSPGMLDAARRKAARQGRGSVRFVEGNAASMEFPDGHFDVVGIAFAFRNLAWRNPLRDRALAEVSRVLAPGGRFVVVETSQPPGRALRTGFHAYLRAAVAPLGGRISGHRAAYRYLARSAREFHDAEEVSGMLRAAGFIDVRVERLMGGVAAIHVATRASNPV